MVWALPAVLSAKAFVFRTNFVHLYGFWGDTGRKCKWDQASTSSRLSQVQAAFLESPDFVQLARIAGYLASFKAANATTEAPCQSLKAARLVRPRSPLPLSFSFLSCNLLGNRLAWVIILRRDQSRLHGFSPFSPFLVLFCVVGPRKQRQAFWASCGRLGCGRLPARH